MRTGSIAFILMCILIPGLAFAEIFYWVDDQGIEYYTTNPETIPDIYRSRVRPLALPTSPPAPPEMQSPPAPKGVVKIPFTPGSPVMVDARINGAGPISLILDTGSDRTLIALSTLTRLNISTENATRVVLSGVTGKTQVDAVWINSLEVGEVKVGPLLIIAHDADLRGAEGLLGRDFLANFNVTIDSKERVVTLLPH